MKLRLPTLEAIEAAVWIELSRAVRDKAHGWRTPVLATVDADVVPPRADARTVILRETDEAQRTLAFFTDSRSPKARQLGAHPHATLVMWSPAMQWQLRCDVLLSMDTDGPVAARLWERLKTSAAAADYLSFTAPGSPLDPGSPAWMDSHHFAVVTAQVLAIDWLELHAQGHRRARFEPGTAAWLQP